MNNKNFWLGLQPTGPVTINYTYDPLGRLTAADYSTGDSYRYAYDAVGNRLQQQTSVNGQQSTVGYQYDIANRLTNVGGVDYTWDANGNLLNDGASTYTYDPANRMSSVTQGINSYTYNYNGLGDRLQQTVNGQRTDYTLDLNAGLTQVLDDGTNTYAYGVDRISQQHGSTAEYFLGDALGSVRQLADANSTITLTKSYDPYGNVISSAGSSTSIFGFTGEAADQSGLTYLRARYYAPKTGRYLTKDLWQVDDNRPLSYNQWNYVEGNPVNYADPTGHIKEDRDEALRAFQISLELESKFNISIDVTWGYYGYNDGELKSRIPLYPIDTPIECRHYNFGWIWHEGNWTIDDLEVLDNAAHIMSIGIRSLGGNFTSLAGPVKIVRGSINGVGDARSDTTVNQINLRDDIKDSRRRPAIIIHEMGHVITYNQPATLSYIMRELGASCINGNSYCYDDKNYDVYDPGDYAGNLQGPNKYEHLPSVYALAGSWEDYAETFTVVVSEAYIRSHDKTYNPDAKLVYEQNGYDHDIGRRRKVMKAILGGTWR